MTLGVGDQIAEAALDRDRPDPDVEIAIGLDFDPRAPAHSFARFATREREVREAAARWAALKKIGSGPAARGPRTPFSKTLAVLWRRGA